MTDCCCDPKLKSSVAETETVASEVTDSSDTACALTDDAETSTSPAVALRRIRSAALTFTSRSPTTTRSTESESRKAIWPLVPDTLEPGSKTTNPPSPA